MKRIANKLDGGKRRARRRYHKALRASGKREARAALYDDLLEVCKAVVNTCGCDHTVHGLSPRSA